MQGAGQLLALCVPPSVFGDIRWGLENHHEGNIYPVATGKHGKWGVFPPGDPRRPHFQAANSHFHGMAEDITGL